MTKAKGPAGPQPPRHRLVITVCPRECGRILLPPTRGARPRRLDARAIVRQLTTLTARRGLEAFVELREACAGGCWLAGPNVSVSIHPVTPPGERPDHVAVGWKSYVGRLDEVASLDAVIDDNLA